MKYTFEDIKSSLTKKKNSRSSLWVQLWVRKASFPVTYLFINAGWTANMVSVLSWIVIFVAAVLLSIDNFGCMLTGVILTNFWLVLDCVDGNIARAFYCRCRKSDNKQRSMRYTPFRLHQQAERTYNRNEHRRPWYSYRLHGKPYILQADMPQPPPYQRQIFRIFHSRKYRFSRCNGSDCKDRILK